jgi:glycogen(starch) synthase
VHNQTGLRILVDQFHMDAREVAVIPHGPLNLPSPATVPDSEGEGVEPLRLLVFGSLRENKGLHLAIGAIQHLRRLTLDRPVCLTIAGRTPNLREAAYWESCKRQIGTQVDGIEVIERLIEDAEVGALFARHDAVLLPYVQFFSDSGVAMLSLSQQRPILATGAGGLGELLQATDCGILIEATTVEAVLAAIETARLAPAAWLKKKGLNGYRYAFNGRSWSAIARQTEQLYDGLVASPAWQ